MAVSRRKSGSVPEFGANLPVGPLYSRKCPTPRRNSILSRNWKWWRQTGSRQSTPLSTIRTRYGNSVSTPRATQTCKFQQNSLQKGSRCGISAPTPHRRYGHGRLFCGRHFRDFYLTIADNPWADCPTKFTRTLLPARSATYLILV